MKKAILSQGVDISRWIIHRTFVDGEIVRKYAWETVLYKLMKDGTLSRVLDKIIEDEPGE